MLASQLIQKLQRGIDKYGDGYVEFPDESELVAVFGVPLPPSRTQGLPGVIYVVSDEKMTRSQAKEYDVVLL